ncbi:hypothetical protein ACFW95_20280 [Streptomyces sp. NPDC059474]|uniref:hypothetical protein n=1 Tax=Streptomyces sp. NPDC059474 TaxID=3346846 RepID=UPI0036B9E01F
MTLAQSVDRGDGGGVAGDHDGLRAPDSRGAAAAAAVLGADTVVPAHYDGWAHFSEGLPEIELAFHEAGLSALVRVAAHGTWVQLTR